MIKSFYEKKYKDGEEIQRTSKLYALGLLPKTGCLKVLDVGCGSGLNSVSISEAGHSVTGIDISKEGIRKYRERGFKGCVMDIQNGMGFREYEFDVVFCSEVIEHLADPETCVKEMCRVLRPEGLLIVSVPNSSFWLYRLTAMIGSTLSEIQHSKHLVFFSKRSLSKLLLNSGLKPIIKTGRNMYLLMPDPKYAFLRKMVSLVGFRKETRFRTNSHFWHLSHQSAFFNSLFAETLIMVAKRAL